jgi:hypothetical protein
VSQVNIGSRIQPLPSRSLPPHFRPASLATKQHQRSV